MDNGRITLYVNPDVGKKSDWDIEIEKLGFQEAIISGKPQQPTKIIQRGKGRIYITDGYNGGR